VYDRLREFLKAQIDPDQRAERISAPGYIAGSARLMNGQVLPAIWPELRGMFNWTTAALVNAVCGERPSKEASAQKTEAYKVKCEAVRNFLERVYHELRNLGTMPQERAINFSATNAFNATKIFESALKDGLDLDTIEVERSPICRPESDCWDVKLSFFNPSKVYEQARKVYRFTVDVSDVVPVTVGTVRSWFVR
jgi:cyanobactin maturation PatA/PatG family protease